MLTAKPVAPRDHGLGEPLYDLTEKALSQWPSQADSEITRAHIAAERVTTAIETQHTEQQVKGGASAMAKEFERLRETFGVSPSDVVSGTQKTGGIRRSFTTRDGTIVNSYTKSGEGSPTIDIMSGKRKNGKSQYHVKRRFRD